MEKQIGNFEDISFDDIEGRSVIFNKMIWEEKRSITIFIAILSVILTALTIFGGFVIVLLYILLIWERSGSRLMRALAQKNNLKQENIDIRDLKGNLFKVRYYKNTHGGLVGFYDNKKARFFYYSYTVQSGKHSITYPFTVFEIFFEGIRFPYTLLHYRGNSFFTKRHGAKAENEIKINLEDEFKKHYALYTKDGYGIEIMQTFNQEFIRFLIKEKCNFSIELSDDRLYIYTEGRITKINQLKEFFETANKTVDSLAPVLKRLEDDFEVLEKYYN